MDYRDVVREKIQNKIEAIKQNGNYGFPEQKDYDDIIQVLKDLLDEI